MAKRVALRRKKGPAPSASEPSPHVTAKMQSTLRVAAGGVPPYLMQRRTGERDPRPDDYPNPGPDEFRENVLRESARLEDKYRESGNALYVWAALKLDWTGEPLPEWIRGYLWLVGLKLWNVVTLASRDSRKARRERRPDLLLEAFGFQDERKGPTLDAFEKLLGGKHSARDKELAHEITMRLARGLTHAKAFAEVAEEFAEGGEPLKYSTLDRAWAKHKDPGLPWVKRGSGWRKTKRRSLR